MPVRKKGQSQLDYLWDNFAKLKKLVLQDNILTGIDEDGELTQLLINCSFPSSSEIEANNIVLFGRREIEGVLYYFILLRDGTEFTVLTETQDLLELQSQVLTNLELILNVQDALLIINGDSEGSLVNILQQAKDYTDSKLINLDVSKLETRVDDINDRLTILENKEDNILEIVKTEIQSSLEWEKL